jgi:Coenzyme PQQ synthesis protein D (PqqD)
MTDHADQPDGRDERLRPSPDVVSRRLDGAGVLVHLPTNRIFELNETGIRIWELLSDGRDHAGVVNHLVEEFDVDAERAGRELNDLLHRFQREGLIGS